MNSLQAKECGGGNGGEWREAGVKRSQRDLAEGAASDCEIAVRVFDRGRAEGSGASARDGAAAT
jgi:hypothetical protein